MSKIYVDEIAGIASPSSVAIPGHVIQVVQDSYSTSLEVTTPVNGTWYASGLSGSITPSSTDSKILIQIANSVRGMRSDGSAEIGVGGRINRDSTVIHTISNAGRGLIQLETNASQTDLRAVGRPYISYLDSPNTTSEITYSFDITGYTGMSYLTAQYGSTPATITLMEIAG